MAARLPALKLVRRSTTGLPLDSLPPAFIMEAGGCAHVVAADIANQGAVHGALDREGALVSAMSALPISPVAAVACGNAAVVAGVHQRTRARCVIGVDENGEPGWEIALPITVSGLVSVVPVCVAGELVIVWEAVSATAGELGVAAALEGRMLPPAISLQPGTAYGLDAVAIGSSLFVLRRLGAELCADVLRIEDGTVIARAQTMKNSHAIAAVGSRLAVLAWTPKTLLLQWLDSSLAPRGAPEAIATAEPPAWVRYATLHAADEDRIAVSYLTGARGDPAPTPGGRSETEEHVRNFVGRYDATARTLADVSELVPAATAWRAGAWLGDRLLFVHGTTGAALSVFELDRGAG